MDNRTAEPPSDSRHNPATPPQQEVGSVESSGPSPEARRASQIGSAGDMTIYHLPQEGSSPAEALPQAAPRKSFAAFAWSGLVVLLVLAIGAAVYLALRPGVTAARPAPILGRTPTPIRTWVPVGLLQPDFEADYGKTREIFENGSYVYLMELSSESSQPEMYSPGTQYYTSRLRDPTQWVLLGNGWCTKDSTILFQNLDHYDCSVTVNGRRIPKADLHYIHYNVPAGQSSDMPDGASCAQFGIFASDWPEGENHVVETFAFDESVNDGWAIYAPGAYVFDYTVLVGP